MRGELRFELACLLPEASVFLYSQPLPYCNMGSVFSGRATEKAFLFTEFLLTKKVILLLGFSGEFSYVSLLYLCW